MPTNQLISYISDSNKEKVAIGYAIDDYGSVLTKIGKIYQKKLPPSADGSHGDTPLSAIEYESPEIKKILSSGLGEIEIDQTQKAENGFYDTDQMAVVELLPAITVPYYNSDNTFSTVRFTGDGICSKMTYAQTKPMGVPHFINNNTISEYDDSVENFLVGTGIGFNGQFGQEYIDRFYNGKIKKEDLSKLASKGFLYTEVFFPVESKALILVARVLYATDGGTHYDNNKDLTFWKCYLPAPVLLLDGYNTNFTITYERAGKDISRPTYGTSAVYSYAKAEIQGFGPKVIKEQINSRVYPTCSKAIVTKWPGVNEKTGETYYGRVRLIVPPMFKTRAEEALGKKLPDSFTTMKDNSIPDGITQVVVQGSDMYSTLTYDGDIYFNKATAGGVTAEMYVKALQALSIHESGTKELRYSRISVEDDGLNLGFWSIGLEHGNLNNVLLHYKNNPKANEELKNEWIALEPLIKERISTHPPKNGGNHRDENVLYKKIGVQYKNGTPVFIGKTNNCVVSKDSLWMRTVNDPAFCYAQTQSFWLKQQDGGYGAGQMGCDDWNKAHFNTNLALYVCIELRNWRPGYNTINEIKGETEKERLLSMINAAVRMENDKTGQTRQDYPATKVMRDVVNDHLESHPNLDGAKINKNTF